MKDKTREQVLPSGRFARIERATYGDWVACCALGANGDNVSVAFASRVVTIDGHAVSPAEILDMDIDDGIAVIAMANALVESALKTMRGVA